MAEILATVAEEMTMAVDKEATVVAVTVVVAVEVAEVRIWRFRTCSILSRRRRWRLWRWPKRRRLRWWP